MNGRVLCAGLLSAALLGATGSAPTVTAAALPVFVVQQLGFPPQLVVRTDRVEIGYKAQRAPNSEETPSAAGTLYVRNDLQRRYTGVPLALRKGLQSRALWAVVPRRFLSGRRLFYYGVVRDRVTGRTVTIPARGARAPESTWIINDAVHVKLGRVVYGHTRTPDAIAARANPSQVGFGRDGLVYGPSSFEVAKDGSIWLFDSVRHRLLQWLPRHPHAIARTVSVPGGFEFALGPAGSIYVLYGRGPGSHLTRLSASGKPLWTSKLGVAYGGQLRTGPDGTLYWTGPMAEPRDLSNWMPRWVPVATPAGRPLPLSAQWSGTRWTQPLTPTLSLVASSADFEPSAKVGPAPHEARLALVDCAGRVVRAWRVTSPTIIWWYTKKTPALVGGDPVIVLTAHWPARAPGRQLEYLALRLGPTGTVRTRFTLPDGQPPRSAYGDEPSIVTDLRVGPDGSLYQLGSGPHFGAAVYRHSLGPVAETASR